jgi:hypothetical protein
MFEGIDAYPLSWPVGWPRTEVHRRAKSAFAERTLAKARDFVLDELRMLGARGVIISTNIELRQDGLPRSGRRAPIDTGVAVYFSLKGRPCVLACDAWNKVEDNLWAIGKHVEAIRGQERWKVGTVEQAFSGYQALPAPTPDEWWNVLGVPRDTHEDGVRMAYRALAIAYHPDSGGSLADNEKFLKVQAAYERAKKERGWK